MGDQVGPARPPTLLGGGRRSSQGTPRSSSSLLSSSSTSSVAMPPPQERFEFLSVIGTGSFGSVYLARDRCGGPRHRRGVSGGGSGSGFGSFHLRSGCSSGAVVIPEQEEDGDGVETEVAIKVVNLEEQEDEMEEIQREIAVLAHSSHCPQLTRYHGSYVVDRALWIVMEYLEGGSLGDLMALAPQGRVSEPVVAHTMQGLCRALAYLHGERKIHRDVKAKNILVSSSGHVKLADFGAAAQLTETKGKRNTFAGTPFWMAPEVITQTSYDAKADIWSVGITAIELAKGQPPYATTHPVRALFLIPKNAPPRLENDEEQEGKGGDGDEGERIRSGAGGGEGPGGKGERAAALFSAGFKDFVARCLVKDPAERPSATELLDLPFLSSEAAGARAVAAQGRRGLVELVEMRRAQQQQQQEQQAAAAAAAADFQEFDHPFQDPHHHEAGDEEEGPLRATRRRIAALELESEDEEGGDGDVGMEDPQYASTPNRAQAPAGGGGWGGRTSHSHSPAAPFHHHRRRPGPPSLSSPCPSADGGIGGMGIGRQLSSVSTCSSEGDGGGYSSSSSTPSSRHRRPGHHGPGGHHHVRRRTGGGGIGRQHSFGAEGADDLPPALPPPTTTQLRSPHLTNLNLTRTLSNTSVSSAVTLPATGGRGHPGGSSGACSPFFPLGDCEGEYYEGEEEEEPPRWDFSLKGDKDLEALMATAPTGAGARLEEEEG